ncbi:CHAP domain-containing protein [Psychrobacter sp. GP33]|uniref:CHAP domain-containing protein n=1 Tax=Psychrobacter sp. GP33 TaxID=2758709 RepID=UPI0015F8D4C1|nr:CHAP domain-containing protein [Psychrobacter sp. GP33]
MKKALLILSVLSMGVAQTSGASVNIISNSTLADSRANIAKSNSYGSSQNIYSTNNGGVHVSNNTEITRAINVLKQKGSELDTLSRRLYAEKKEQFKSVLDHNSAPAIAAARASRVALSRSSGYCARYVRKALQSAGYDFTPNPSAYQYATRGTLAQAGFTKISNDMPTQIGDVVVFDRSSKHPHGHIQIFDGSNWISDFRQNSISPYSNIYGYSTWRDSQYVDDASNRGIYLAMADK